MERDTIDLALVRGNMQGIKVTKSDINVSKCGAFDIDNMRGMTRDSTNYYLQGHDIGRP